MNSSIVAVVVPKWGLEMTEGTVSSWLKNAGDVVVRGEPLLEIESEKIVNIVDAPGDGILRRITLEAGTVGSIGALAGILADEATSEEEIDQFVRSFRAPLAEESAVEYTSSASAPAPAPTTAPTTATTPASAAPVRVSPPVRRLAEKLGVSLDTVRGSGPNGRILQEDVERAAHAGSSGTAAVPLDAPRFEPWSATRRAIARKMQDSAREVPHFYLVMDVSATSLLAARERARVDGSGPSLNDLLVHTAARVLLRHPRVNAHWSEAGLLVFPGAHIAVAVATADGVLAPVLRNADRLSLTETAAALAELRARVGARRLGPGDLEGASFTISNLGMYGIREFTSIISAPQCASLAVGAVRKSDGSATLTLTLSCDHRALDGAAGATFLQELKAALENL